VKNRNNFRHLLHGGIKVSRAAAQPLAKRAYKKLSRPGKWNHKKKMCLCLRAKNVNLRAFRHSANNHAFKRSNKNDASAGLENER
jgi:hypothetical protein